MALSGAFTYPSVDDFAAAFQAGFCLPAYLFLIAVVVAKAASFFDRG